MTEKCVAGGKTFLEKADEIKSHEILTTSS